MKRLDVSGAVRPLYGSLGVKGLIGKRCGVRVVGCVCGGQWVVVRDFNGKVSFLFIKLIIRCIHQETASDTQPNDNQRNFFTIKPLTLF